MLFDLDHHLDSSSSSDAESAGKAPGKRTLTAALPRQGAPGASAAQASISSPAPEAPDAFDFSYAQPLDPNDQAVEAEVQRHLEAGERDVNAITDAAYYRLYPELAGEKIAKGSEQARTWLWLRDMFVTPALRRAPAATPAPSPSPEADVYRTQNDNLYMAGGTCNMTSLTMALLSFADGDETLVKQKAGTALQRLGKPLGGIKIDGKREDLRHAIETPGLLARIQVEDLLTTLANLKGLKVTHGDTILAIAKETELVATGKAGITGYLKDTKTRARAAEMLAQGQQVILGVQGGPGHYVFLTQVLDDGIVVHDPAGCRCQYDAPYFLPTAQATTYWLKTMMTSLGRAGWTEAARRRLSHNPGMLEIVEHLVAARRLAGKEQASAIKELATGGPLAMGESNFYSLADIAHYKMDIRVEMQGT
ncbi:MAG: hypothetical protein F9K40_18435 [Kofleriaceae bacterium]|nr:MAG: hypothetical protein F9K40_18435 [Kofleriaceae bacterium]MBZ0237704.1 hypothetical protein [Kofleriaceae bacterium]